MYEKNSEPILSSSKKTVSNKKGTVLKDDYGTQSTDGKRPNEMDITGITAKSLQSLQKIVVEKIEHGMKLMDQHN